MNTSPNIRATALNIARAMWGWAHQAEVDGGRRAGLSPEECKRLKLLEREISGRITATAHPPRRHWP